ncbi:MAG: class I mannose-6-phosphate isomerase [Verrucomicrobia bacterium]|nr:class I mannose-6-phosphate isomerase [Verrucomicrobiota bacterium]
MLYPLTFHPLFKERVWGGRKLETLFHKPLPPGRPYGESWEISDRPGDVSIIANGSLAGRDLRWLMERYRDELLGEAAALDGKFPLLVKILDAQEKLSLQVHPPARLARGLGGEPKTEMWYFVAAEPDAEIFVGLKRGVTRAEFARKISDGTVAECFHRVAVRRGDAMFLPSGRVHAIGGGSVIFEIQQNSDTTYRVFDWNRAGLDGKPRELHVEQSLVAIDFSDFEPALVVGQPQMPAVTKRQLVPEPLTAAQSVGSSDVPFRVELRRIVPNRPSECEFTIPVIVGVASGQFEVRSAGFTLALNAGQFALLPACLRHAVFHAREAGEVLLASPASIRKSNAA